LPHHSARGAPRAPLLEPQAPPPSRGHVPISSHAPCLNHSASCSHAPCLNHSASCSPPRKRHPPRVQASDTPPHGLLASGTPPHSATQAFTNRSSKLTATAIPLVPPQIRPRPPSPRRSLRSVP
jgi:hypothetical protein